MMGLNPVKIAENNITDIQAQIRQKSQEAAGKTGLKTIGNLHDITEDDLNTAQDNELVFYGESTDFKTYRFNGRINRGETHLGTNFDMVV